jgi:hypothetical protein
MMDAMKLLLFFLAVSSVHAADLAQVRNVYILTMGGGLDLHIANRLTDGHVLQVVTDPQKADAVLTDRLGPAFEDQMTRLYPPPEPPKEESAEKEKDKEKDDASSIAAAFSSDAAAKIAKPMSSFGRGKGTIFLVGVKSREVLWSTYALPKDSRADTLERTAGKITNDLKKDLGKK